ncbi:hypothetical protein O3M35_011470 [Rhynocoris fuscipes]|uniref:Uncharacterized protein n=1 Tax=Rhynocoris fuscipes TaxID=488301 RepID=A0AAW1CXN2_9HEMI
MEFTEIINTQYAFHGIIVGCVLAFAILVFVFGFKSAEEPPFDKLTNAHEDRKGTGKKKKLKDKKNQSNGHVTAVTDGIGTTSGSSKRSGEVKSPKKDGDKSPAKEQKKQEKKSPSKAALKESKQNKDDKPIGSGNNNERKARGKENVEIKNKKNKVVDEKPKDFDDGEWEQALSKRDKKNRKTALEEILPQKSDKKKEKKKGKEEPELKAEVTPEIAEEIVEVKEKIVIEKSEPTSQDTSIEPTPVEDTKPKKAKKKKQNSESSTSGIEDKPFVSEEPVSQPKPQRQKKVAAPPEVSSAPPPEDISVAPEPEKIEVQNSAPVAESNVVFDELGGKIRKALLLILF